MTLRSVAQKRGGCAAPEGGEEGETRKDVDREHGLAKAAGRCTSNQDINMQAGSKLHSF